MTRDDAPFAYPGLERIFHERGRLAVCTCLVAFPDGLSFSELRDKCGLTDGNLNRHLQALAEVDVVVLEKSKKKGCRPRTVCRVTSFGRERFLSYIQALESVVREAQSRAHGTCSSPGRATEGGLAAT